MFPVTRAPPSTCHTRRTQYSITLCVRMGAAWVDFAFSQLTRCCYCIGEKIKRGKGQREEKTEGKREGEEDAQQGVPGAGRGRH